MGNSSRDGNTRPPYLTPEKSICRSRSYSYNWTRNIRLVPNWESSYAKSVYCHPAYLTYMQIISHEMLDEAQAGIKIAWRNINSLRYADDTTLMAESEEELKTLLMKVKMESEKVGLKLRV